MTTLNKATLKTFFETNDVPTGSDYGNLIDSSVNLAETAIQVMSGPLNITEVVTPRISAATGTYSTGVQTVVVSAASTYSDNLQIALAANFACDVSANASTVYASAVRSVNGVLAGAGIVSAAGITQGAAASLINVINRGKGVVDGTTTGYTPLANRAGLVQYLLNEGVSANLWPPTGGFINGLAVNIPFPLVASAAYTIFHITASSYGVK